MQEAVNRFFVLPVFVLLGLALPWQQWLELGWAGLLLVVAVLLLRRLPAVLAVTTILPQARGLQGTLFLGWFGPIGVAALFYASLSLREIGADEAWVVGSLTICASILIYGVTAAPLTRFYERIAKDEGSDG